MGVLGLPLLVDNDDYVYRVIKSYKGIASAKSARPDAEAGLKVNYSFLIFMPPIAAIYKYLLIIVVYYF